MTIKHTKTAVPDVDKVDCTDWNADHTAEEDPVFTAWDKDHVDLTNVTANQHHTPTAPVPTGSIIMYGAATAPTGYLLCNGAAVARVGIYAALFAVIGTTYGIGDGSTTFNLPNFASKFPRGNTPGATGNQSASHTHQTDIGTHYHQTQVGSGAGSAGSLKMFYEFQRQTTGNYTTIEDVGTKTSGNQSADHNHTISSDGVVGTNQNIPAYLGANFIIKY